MLKDIWNSVKYLVEMASDLHKCHAEIRDARQELLHLTIIVHSLTQEIKHSKERADIERLNLLLEVDNRLLKLENHLESSKESRQDKRKREPKSSLSSVIASKKINRK